MNHLSLPEVAGLATWSFGMVITKSSSLTQVSNFIAKVNGEKPNTVRQRLKEWYQEAEAKRGKKRSSLDVSSCFAPLMRWVISLLPRNINQIALALDATSISDKFVVLSMNILLAGCGIPIAWCVVKATEPGSWKPHWQKLIEKLQNAIPCSFDVIVTADRGLYAPWLYQLIVDAGWHPFLRINHQGTYRIPPDNTWHSLAVVVRTPGVLWSSRVVCFQTHPLPCTLLACWDIGYKDPWLILTDLEPQQADPLWYGLRPSTECVYRDIKSDGWQWHNTRLLYPKRAERLWLAIAVSTLWMVMLGGDAENQSLTPNLEQLPPQHIAFSKPLNRKPLRQISCFLLGLLTLSANLLNNIPIYLHRWSSFP
ncbi:endonuclease, partial [Nostoc sp. UIC 10607]|uniref:endonuclease n=1 Tax=Nostoc sp. UIC 10607 TaxID=3045935 RepID=UPI0039A063FF